MKIFILSILFFLHGCAMIQYEPINANLGQKKQSLVTWEIIENPSKFCKEKYNLKTNDGNLILACTSWQGEKCTIYTDKNPSYELLGHELRHCFDHNWHK